MTQMIRQVFVIKLAKDQERQPSVNGINGDARDRVNHGRGHAAFPHRSPAE